MVVGVVVAVVLLVPVDSVVVDVDGAVAFVAVAVVACDVTVCVDAEVAADVVVERVHRLSS